MRLMYVPLTQDTVERLAMIARKERRRPQDQAACLLEKALRDQDEVARKEGAEVAHVQ